MDSIGFRLAQRKEVDRNFRRVMSNLREYIQFQKSHAMAVEWGWEEYECGFGGYNRWEGMWMAVEEDGRGRQHIPIVIRQFY